MPSFFLTMLAALLASLGGRDQRLVAQVSDRLGQPLPLLVAAVVAASLTAAMAAFAATLIAPLMPAPAKLVLVAMALVLAAAEMAWNARARRKPPAEPAYSFFPALVVLVAHQIGDGARFLVFALAIAMSEPALAAAGGAFGSIVALGLGWALGIRAVDHPAVRAGRIGVAALLAIIAVIIAYPIII